MDRVSVSDLYEIKEEDLRAAIESFDSRRASHRFEQSRRFDILHENRRYPPKAIVGLAAEKSIGRILGPDDFSGGESSSSLRLLLDRGFEIATKPRPVGQLDATFSVTRLGNSVSVIVESRGPERNREYAAGLEAILAGLAARNATLMDAAVDSLHSAGLPHEMRRLRLSQHEYPISLHDTSDLRSLRRDLGSAAARTDRDADSKGGGNPTKRLRLNVSLPGEVRLHELAEFLSAGETANVSKHEEFVFRPRAPSQSSDPARRKAVDASVVTRLHVEMQQILYAKLVEKHGTGSVSAEQPAACGRPADLFVRTPAGFEIYEIKTAQSPRDCIREAIGQLLEYGYWPGSPKVSALWIVGTGEPDDVASNFLRHLRERFGIPIDYIRCSPVNSNEASTPGAT